MNLEKVDKIVKYAFLNVPHYKRTLQKNGINPLSENVEEYFPKIPILSKEEILNNTNDFISTEFDESSVEVDRTSGSTGKILNIYWEKSDRLRSLLSLWTQRKLLYNICPDSKCCYFHSIAYRTASDISEREVFSPRIMIRDGGKILSLSKLSFDDKTLGIYYDKMLNFQPEWIMCHPSTLYMFMKFAKKYNKESFEKLRFIELTGEYLIDSYRNKISNFFNVPIANHYGAKEVNGIAYECKNGHLHCLENNVHVEIIENGKNIGYDKKGHVCVTGLNNRCMPFVRYDLGDIAIMRKGISCGCGNQNPYLEICAGRGNEIIKLDNGTKIECVVFFYIIEWINSLINDEITQFQILRISNNIFKVLLTIDNYSELKMKKIRTMFESKSLEYGFREVTWDFEFVNEILPKRDTEKLNFFYDIRK